MSGATPNREWYECKSCIGRSTLQLASVAESTPGAQDQVAAHQWSPPHAALGLEETMRTHSETALLPLIGRLYDSILCADDG